MASPRQKVVAEAPVPLLRLVTGRLPVTPLERLTCAQAGSLLVPVLERYLVAVIFFANAEITSVAEPYKMSPCATLPISAIVCPGFGAAALAIQMIDNEIAISQKKLRTLLSVGLIFSRMFRIFLMI